MHRYEGQRVNGKAEVQAVIQPVKISDKFITHGHILDIFKNRSASASDFAEILMTIGSFVLGFELFRFGQELRPQPVFRHR